METNQAAREEFKRRADAAARDAWREADAVIAAVVMSVDGYYERTMRRATAVKIAPDDLSKIKRAMSPGPYGPLYIVAGVELRVSSTVPSGAPECIEAP